MAELITTSFFNDANLVSYWRAEGNSNDSKGSNNGTDTSVTYNASNGKFGQGAGFNGSTSKIVIADASNLRLNGSFTVHFWTKNSLGVNGVNFIQSWSDNPNVAGWRIFTAGSGANLSLQQGKNTGNTNNVDFFSLSGTTTINDNNWHACDYTWNGTTAAFYVDGVLDQSTSSNTMNAAYAGTNYIRIGCNNDTGTDGGFYTGSLDDIAIFSRALSATEVRGLYTASAGGAALFFV